MQNRGIPSPMCPQQNCRNMISINIQYYNLYAEIKSLVTQCHKIYSMNHIKSNSKKSDDLKMCYSSIRFQKNPLCGTFGSIFLVVENITQ